MSRKKSYGHRFKAQTHSTRKAKIQLNFKNNVNETTVMYKHFLSLCITLLGFLGWPFLFLNNLNLHSTSHHSQ